MPLVVEIEDETDNASKYNKEQETQKQPSLFCVTSAITHSTYTLLKLYIT